MSKIPHVPELRKLRQKIERLGSHFSHTKYCVIQFLQKGLFYPTKINQALTVLWVTFNFNNVQ